MSTPRFVRALIALAFALVAGQILAVAGVPIGGDAWWEDWVSVVVPLLATISVCTRAALVAPQRLAWALLGVGTGCWGAGMGLWIAVFDRGRDLGDLVVFLGLYPCALAFLLLELRARSPRVALGVWLDAAAGMLSVAALGLALVLSVLLPGGADAIQLAFPVGDLAIAGVVVVLFTIARWQPGLDWTASGVAMLALAAGDLLWLVEDASWAMAISTPLWTGGLAVLACAPWVHARALPPPSVAVSGRLPWPFGLFLASFALVVAGNFVEVPRPALWVAVAAILVTTYRSALTYVVMRSLPETRRQARTDELTGLTNRRGFFDALQEQLERHPGRPAAVLMLDLDRFKELNDTMGHQTGDRLLSQLGPRLTAALRPADMLARLGGDEFAVLCPGAGVAGAHRVAERLQAALDKPFELGDLRVHVDASVGIATYPSDGGTPEELLQRADVAMYQAKGDGTEVEHYDASRDDHSRDKLQLVGELRRALDDGGQLELHYQPQVDLRSERVLGAEALVRWRHPERGLLPPGAFLAAAEGAGLMRRLGRALLAQAVAQVAAWQRAGIDLPVAVNLSSAELVDPTFADEVAELLERHVVHGSWLKLEITENSVMAHPERVLETLHRLRELGCAVSLDDFGTGHASLAHLAQLPVDELKIDRSFVLGLDADDTGSAAIVRSVTLLGRDLGLSVVAEGVESRRAWRQLMAAGCSSAQGYLLTPPLPPAELAAWLAARGEGAEPAAA
ncbi:MAG TPA: EAL domain-containing protein [Capillimicrobium sp.]|nr:EAL domain-containing protein [Capillimicrobium sp.]